MTDAAEGRTDTVSRLIHADRRAIYRALLDPVALATWRPPEGMTGRIDAFEAREGGTFRMVLIYNDTSDASADHAPLGKTSAHEDVVEGRFQSLVPDQSVVEVVTFRSDDPAYAGEMTITTTLNETAEGTRVTIRCDNVPAGITAADHQIGLASTLANLAVYCEK